jgi:DNA-directed RNA polymerase specialized sigma subunit
LKLKDMRKDTKKTIVDPEKQKAISEHYMKYGESAKVIAAKFGVSESKVNHITSKALREFRVKQLK